MGQASAQPFDKLRTSLRELVALPQPCPKLVEGKAKRTIRGCTTDTCEGRLDQAEGDRVFSIKPRAVRLVVKKYAAIAGIRKAVRPSVLRHTFAVLALVRGEDYEAVKLILGHEIDDVMQQYVQRAHQLQVLRRRTT